MPKTPISSPKRAVSSEGGDEGDPQSVVDEAVMMHEISLQVALAMEQVDQKLVKLEGDVL